MNRNTFGKHERLTHKRIVERLFQEGKGYKDFPLLLVVLPSALTADVPMQMLVSVSKRQVRKAYRRIHIKRLLREGWRCQKHDVYAALNAAGVSLAAAYVFVGREMPDSATINAKISALNRRLIEDIPNLTVNSITSNET